MNATTDKAQEIERDCLLIDLARAARAAAFHKRTLQRHRELLHAANDEQWRAAMADAAPLRDLEQRERARIRQTIHQLQDVGARAGQVNATVKNASQTGRDDADSMTTPEVRRAIFAVHA